MAPGVTDHIWTIRELIEAATAPVTPEPEGRVVGRFRAIDGWPRYRVRPAGSQFEGAIFRISTAPTVGSLVEGSFTVDMFPGPLNRGNRGGGGADGAGQA